MANDFELFPDPNGDRPVDADAALITAYLARELTVVQVVAVEERLATDTAFRENVRPIIEGWTLPGVFLPDITHALLDAAPKAGVTAHLTRGEIDAGWQRFVGAPAAAIRAGRTIPGRAATRMPSTVRIAAVIALIVLPLVAIAQVVAYVARHPGLPAQELAQSAPPVDTIKQPLGDGGPRPGTLSLAQGVQTVDLSVSSGRTQTLGAVIGVVQTSDGHVLVNDPKNGQVHLFAPSLAMSTLAMDSIPGSAKSYGDAIRAAIPFRGDSMFLIRGGGSGLTGGQVGGTVRQDGLLVDGRGGVARVIDLSMTHDLGLGQAPFYSDPAGNLLYVRGVGVHAGQGTPVEWQCGRAPGARVAGSGPGRVNGAAQRTPGCGSLTRVYDDPDTVPVFRINLSARRVDTVGYIARPRNSVGGGGNSIANGGGKLVVVPRGKGLTDSLKQVINPLQIADDWAVLSDGTIAFVRGQDYHVDWVFPDGTKRSSAKLPFALKQLANADKQRLVDSTRRTVDSLDAEGVARVPGGGTPPALGRGRGLLSSRAQMGFSVAPPPIQRTFAYEIVPLSQIADSWPAIIAGATKADADGNLWVLPRTSSQSRQGELVYDIVNPTQGLVRRVRLPLGRSIAGFGKGGVVYLQAGDLVNGFTLERTTVPK